MFYPIYLCGGIIKQRKYQQAKEWTLDKALRIRITEIYGWEYKC